MSEWFYVRLALGLTWGVFAATLLLFNRRRIAAERALRDVTGGDS